MKNNPTHILFMNTNIAWGGGEKWHYEAALIFKRKGLKIHFLINTESALESKLLENDIPYTKIKVKKLSYLCPIKRNKINNFLKENKITHAITNLPQDTKLLGASSESKNLEKMIYRRGMPIPIKNKGIYKKVFTRNNFYFMAISEDVKKGILTHNSSWMDPEKIKIIFNGLPKESLTQNFDKDSSETIMIGNASRLVEQKGYPYFIEVCNYLKKSNVKFKAQIAGIGPLEEELKNKVKELRLTDHIEFLGHIDQPDAFYNTLDVFLFPSLFEGFSHTVLEAMGHSLPCIAFNMGSMKEQILDSETGFLVEPYDTKEMANKIIKLYNDRELLKTYSKNAYNRVADNFIFEDQVDIFIETFL